MSDNGTVFGSTEVTPAASVTNQADSPVALLVGEGRKYASVEELAKAYVHIDEFAETLKSENSQLREQVTKAKTLDDVIERLSTRDVKPEDKPANTNAPDIARIVQETVTGMETKKSREANLARADAKMRELFGDKAKEVFKTQASTPELVNALTNLASVDPDKFVAIFHKGDKTATPSFTQAGTGVNTAAFQAQNTSTAGDPTTKAYYDELRKKDKAHYYSAGVQLAMHNAALANPDKFWGRKS